mgnify:CR=1 FL=1
MPKVGDKELPYTPKGIQKASKESSKSGIPVSDAGNRAESYQLGGLIPGQPGFGKRPMVNQPASPLEWPEPPSGNKFADVPKDMYKEGGKVGSKTKGKSKQPKDKTSYKAIQAKHKKKKAQRKKVKKYMDISVGLKDQ